jgi:hypothetical protein
MAITCLLSHHTNGRCGIFKGYPLIAGDRKGKPRMIKTKNGWKPFEIFSLWIGGIPYDVTRDQLREAYHSKDWRSAILAVPQAPLPPDTVPVALPDCVYGGYEGDDSKYAVVADPINPDTELAIMYREDASDASEFFGPNGEYPWRVGGGA